MNEALADLRSDLARYRRGDVDPRAVVLAWLEYPVALGVFTRYLAHAIAFAYLYEAREWTYGPADVDFESQLTTRVCVVEPGLSTRDERVVRWASVVVGALVGACYLPLATTWWAQVLLVVNVGYCLLDPAYGWLRATL